MKLEDTNVPLQCQIIVNKPIGDFKLFLEVQKLFRLFLAYSYELY